jgi:hypothetical protein
MAAMSACPTSAITVPINETADAPALTTLQQTAAEVANGAAQIVPPPTSSADEEATKHSTVLQEKHTGADFAASAVS